MRILLCSPYGPHEARGNSVATQRLLAGFVRRGHHADALWDCERAGGAEAAARARAFAPDVVLVLHAWRCAEACHAIRSALACPTVASLRGTDLNEMLTDPARGPAVRAVLDACDAITVFHGAARELLAAQSPPLSAKTRIVPNGLDLPPASADWRAKLGLADHHVVFVGLGGLRDVKRPVWLVETLARLTQHHPNMAYLHAGPELDEQTARRFRELAEEHAWVRTLGVVPHHDVAAFLRAGDVFVSASRSEGMPHSVREAMLCGLPLLLSDNAGHRNMAAEGIEALFFDTPGAFLERASRLIQDSSLRARLGANARRRLERELHGHDEIGAYLALFAELVENRAP